MAETLQDYLVKLGFKVEKGEEARFNSLLGNLAKTVAGISASLTAASGAIATAVVKIAESFDALYFASQRTHASVASIKSLSYALTQVGGVSEQAAAAFEGLAAAIRTNPGAEAFLNAQGVATKVNGQFREAGELIDDIVKKFSGQPYYISRQFANIVGIPDERAWNTFVTKWPEIRKAQKEYLDKAKGFGLDPDKAAESSNKLMTSFRSLMGTVDILSQKIVTDLQPTLTKWFEAISAWFKDHREDIVQALKKVMEAVEGLSDDFGKLVSAMKPVGDAFTGLVKLISGSDEGSLKYALEALAVFMAGSWAMRVLGVVGRLNWALGLAMASIYGLSSITGGTAKDIIQEPSGARGPNGMAGDWIDANGKMHRVSPGAGLPPMSPWNRVKRFFGFGPYSTGGGFGGESAAPREGMAKITSKSGQVAWVDKASAPQFQGFINDLEATGYRIKDLSGFSNRTIAGSGRISQHALGKAIDINPKENDLGTGTGNLPANTGDLADKWGLGWGARWKTKNDPMHVSTDEYEGGRLMPAEESERLLRLQRLEQIEGIKDKTSYLNSPPLLGGAVSRTATLNQKTDITILGSSDPAGSAVAQGAAVRRSSAELLRNSRSAFA